MTNPALQSDARAQDQLRHRTPLTKAMPKNLSPCRIYTVSVLLSATSRRLYRLRHTYTRPASIRRPEPIMPAPSSVTASMLGRPRVLSAAGAGPSGNARDCPVMSGMERSVGAACTLTLAGCGAGVAVTGVSLPAALTG